MSVSSNALDLEQKVTLLSFVSNELIKVSPLKEKLDRILELLEQGLGLRHAVILLPDAEMKVLTIAATRGYPDFEVGGVIPIDRGFVGAVALNQKPIKVSRLSQYRRFVASFQGAQASKEHLEKYPTIPNAESLAVFPILANKELVAVVSFESQELMFFDEPTESLLTSISNQIGLSIQNSMLFDQLEARIQKRTAELEKANAAKNQMFSILAHDLRSPLSSIYGVSPLLNKFLEEKNYEGLNKVVQEIDKGVTRVILLLDNLLAWSVSQMQGIVCKPQNVELHALVLEVASLFSHQLQVKQLRLITDGLRGKEVFADYQMLFSILRNLTSNAIKFSLPNTEVNIWAERAEHTLRIFVKDGGVGIPKTRMQKLFTLGNNASTPGTYREKGSGLGLILVKNFVEMHQGKVEVQSSTKGTTVILDFPFGPNG